MFSSFRIAKHISQASSSARRAATANFAANGVTKRTMSISALGGFQGKNFISIDKLSNEELRGLLDLSKQYRDTYGKDSTVDPLKAPKPLTGQSVSMIFQKRSTRTRVSTETGTNLLGGHALFLGPGDVQLGVNESMKDTALVLSRFNSVILARVFDHTQILELSEHATVPVINALSHLHHPLQTLADLMALEDHFGDVRGKTVCWVGDGNNVLHDLMLGAAKLGMNVRIATPPGYEADAGILETTNKLAAENGTEQVFLSNVAADAVKGSDVVVTDTWVSMGEEDVYEQKMKEFEGYQVNSTLMSQANEGAVFLHCLPRHPEEVSDEVFYSEQSLIFPEAENRMWTVMAVMAAQLGKM